VKITPGKATQSTLNNQQQERLNKWQQGHWSVETVNNKSSGRWHQWQKRNLNSNEMVCAQRKIDACLVTILGFLIQARASITKGNYFLVTRNLIEEMTACC
jgi:hypothetical protein